MDRTVRRINGVKMPLHRLSDGELENAKEFARRRVDSAQQDLYELGQESYRRLELADVALQPTVQLEPVPEPPEAA